MLTESERKALIAAFEAPPYGRNARWTFEYAHPGVFSYRHDDGKRVFFTPDFNEPGYVDIQIVPAGQDEPAEFYAVGYIEPLSPGELYKIVLPYLTPRSSRGSGPEYKNWDPRRRAQMGSYKDWDPRSSIPYKDLSRLQREFLAAYIEAALWAEMDPETEEPLDRNYDTRDIAPETMRAMRVDAMTFLEQNFDDISDDLARAGHDFWLTRQGHGAGFWDGDWPEPAATRLTKASEKFGQMTLEVSNGKIYHL